MAERKASRPRLTRDDWITAARLSLIATVLRRLGFPPERCPSESPGDNRSGYLPFGA